MSIPSNYFVEIDTLNKYKSVLNVIVEGIKMFIASILLMIDS